MKGNKRETKPGPASPLSYPTADEKRLLRRMLLIVVAATVGLMAILFAWTAVRYPSDAVMVSRFESNQSALVNLCPPAFASEQARRLWLRALRIHRTTQLSDCRGVLYWVSSSEGRRAPGYHWDDHKGYAWMPGRPADDTNSRWHVRLPRSYESYHLSPIEGDWYVFEVRIHRP